MVNRRYDICLSVWRLIYERTLFADYTTPVANLPRILMVDGGKVPETAGRTSNIAVAILTVIIVS